MITARTLSSELRPNWYCTQPKKLGSKSITPALIERPRATMKEAAIGFPVYTK